jgi:hypothetical protein
LRVETSRKSAFLPLRAPIPRTKFRASFAGPPCFAPTRRMTGHP